MLGGEERAATPDEIERMRVLLREALEAGAIGFSTSRQPAHQGAFGRPVPSRFAEVDEVGALAAVLGEAGKGILQVSIGPGLFVRQFSELAVRYRIPVTWTALVTRADKPGAALRTVERGGALPGEVYPQIACRPIVMQISMTDPAPLAEIDEWKEVLALSPRGAGRPVRGRRVAGPGPAGHARGLEPPLVEDRRAGDRRARRGQSASRWTGWPPNGAPRRST